MKLRINLTNKFKILGMIHRQPITWRVELGIELATAEAVFLPPQKTCDVLTIAWISGIAPSFLQCREAATLRIQSIGETAFAKSFRIRSGRDRNVVVLAGSVDPNDGIDSTGVNQRAIRCHADYRVATIALRSLE